MVLLAILMKCILIIYVCFFLSFFFCFRYAMNMVVLTIW